MNVRPRGWFELEVPGTGDGTLYRFRLSDGQAVPDPASRFQPQDVMGPSEVIDPRLFPWSDIGWAGRPWEDMVLYELHIGTFTPEGSFAAAIEKLDYLAALGITGIQMMPVNDFPGRWNWGYDGVLLFAPDSSYGRPDDLKAFIDAAHARNICVLIDVIYNHFGPKGNFLPSYAPVLTDAHETPWGAALNFDGPGSEMVRDFILANARFWLNEYHFDGLRLDAVHQIKDDGFNHLLHDLALDIRASTDGRYTHLVVENEENDPHWLSRTGDLRPGLYDAQWNDDVHHLLDVALYGEASNYWTDYSAKPGWLPRALATGFGFQGEPVPTRQGAPKGAPSGDLPPVAFVSFLQNHDQVGNRLFGERIAELAELHKARAAVAIYLLAPQIPMLFMGEEWGSRMPFLYFSDVDPAFRDDIISQRSKNFGPFVVPAKRNLPPPDPMAKEAFDNSKLDWSALEGSNGEAWFTHYQALLAVRRLEIAPRLEGVGGNSANYRMLSDGGFAVDWLLSGSVRLALVANLSDAAIDLTSAHTGRELWREGQVTPTQLGPWAVRWTLDGADRQ
jgi:maltooligosyltrehalose trehalohydrolase